MAEWQAMFVLKGNSKPVIRLDGLPDSSVVVKHSIVGTVVTLTIEAWRQESQVFSNIQSWPLDYYEYLLFAKLAELCRSVEGLSRRLGRYTYPQGVALKKQAYVMVSPPVRRIISKEMRLWEVETRWFLQETAFVEKPINEGADLSTYKLFKMHSLREWVEEFGEQMIEACEKLEGYCEPLLPAIEIDDTDETGSERK
ncbi:MAG TPA: hypothetical protein VKV29_07455 [Chthonomonas sp.]|uniref:hypothetical protein n=1 Tax=Chthonomonas sp. TaxID=2282153 RepID=UPI002B4ABDEC|nr:hypothetical protein [Chthonomonas sp.]HLH80104.1 hypothetical protein [Chthonomonas sp.]